MLHWGIVQDTTYLLPQVNLSAVNLTEEAVDEYCRGKSAAFNFPLSSFLAPSDNISVAPSGAVFLQLRAGLLICGASPSLSDTYVCMASNPRRESLAEVRVAVSIPSGVLPDAIVAVIVILLLALLALAPIGCCCFLRYRSRLKRDDWERMTRRNHIPYRHSFTNHTFDRYPSNTEQSGAEFDRDKLHFISLLGESCENNTLLVLFTGSVDFALGEGQFGQVWKATAEGICPHDANRSIVAVKMLKGETIIANLEMLTGAIVSAGCLEGL